MTNDECRKFIDNLQLVADELVRYILDDTHQTQLFNAISNIDDQGPGAWIHSHLQRLYCKAAENIKNHETPHLCSPWGLLEVILFYFSMDAWGYTSKNTALMKLLIRMLPLYNHQTENEFLTENILRRLNDLFLMRARQAIRYYQSQTETPGENKELLIDTFLRTKFKVVEHENNIIKHHFPNHERVDEDA